jgi:hypothetical protein
VIASWPMFAEAPTTRWTRIQSARGDAKQQRILWDELFRVYWKPLFFMARRKGLGTDAASDAVQSFAEKMIGGSLLENADSERGRLRSYLAKSFQHHLASQHERDVAAKRGGLSAHVDVQSLERELKSTDGDPLRAFEQGWAASVLTEAKARMRAEHTEKKYAGDFELLERYLGGVELPPLAELAATTRTSTAFLKSFFHRGRQKFREECIHVVKDSLGDEGILASLAP